MKTEQELLISYMYREGYTEEDMYDENTLRVVRDSFGFRLFHTAFILAETAASAVKAFKEWVANLVDCLSTIKEDPPSLFHGTVKHANIYESITAIDQVMDRKPRHLVKKIIR